MTKKQEKYHRNDKNKRNILRMPKTRKVSLEWQKQKSHRNGKNKKVIRTTKQQYHSERMWRICHPEFFPFVILSVSEGSFVANAPSEWQGKRHPERMWCIVSSRTYVMHCVIPNECEGSFILNYYYFLDFSKTSIIFICYFWFIEYHHHY